MFQPHELSPHFPGWIFVSPAAPKAGPPVCFRFCTATRRRIPVFPRNFAATYTIPCRVPTGSGKQGNNGQGIYYGPQVMEKSVIFLKFRPKVRLVFSRMAQCRDFYKILKISIGPTCISIPWNITHDLNIDGHTKSIYVAHYTLLWSIVIMCYYDQVTRS